MACSCCETPGCRGTLADAIMAFPPEHRDKAIILCATATEVGTAALVLSVAERVPALGSLLVDAHEPFRSDVIEDKLRKIVRLMDESSLTPDEILKEMQ